MPAYDPENPLVKKPTNGDNRTLVIGGKEREDLERGGRGRTRVKECGAAERPL